MVCIDVFLLLKQDTFLMFIHVNAITSKEEEIIGSHDT